MFLSCLHFAASKRLFKTEMLTLHHGKGWPVGSCMSMEGAVVDSLPVAKAYLNAAGNRSTLIFFCFVGLSLLS